MPRFSVLIPVYNVENYLDDCLQSVLAQSFADCEVIAVNDGSSDRSNEILERYRSAFSQQHIPYSVILQSNQGLGAARNTALNHATGDYILFLDSDDMLQPSALARLNENLHGEDFLCFNGQRIFDETRSLEPPQSLQAEGPLSGWEYFNRHALEPRLFPFVCVVLRCYRRLFIMENKVFFNTDVYHEDNLFTPIACSYAQRISVIPDVLYTYRIRSGSITAKRSLKHKHDLILIANSLSHKFHNSNDVDLSVLYRYITQLYQMAFADNTKADDRQLLPTVQWNYYHLTSRTRMRHRILYRALRISPSLFRFILHTL